MWRQLVILSVAVFSGCYHTLEVVNQDQFNVVRVNDSRKKGLKVALAYSAPTDMLAKDYSPCDREFLFLVAKSLRDQAGYQAFVAESPKAIRAADVAVRLSEKVVGSAHGSNFLVALPGCILFSYAWLGFGYDVNWQYQMSLVDSTGGATIQESVSDRKMEVRFTEWSGHEGYDTLGNGYFSSMWYLPPLGTIFAIVNAGIQASDYYQSTTVELRESGKLKMFVDGVAQEIIAAINSCDVKRRFSAEELLEKQKSDDEIRLKQLLDAGIISREEYETEINRVRNR